MQATLQRYTKTALFNLFLVAVIGVVLRYKIAFSLPFIDQKHLLHAHSHFAFTGWITHALFVLLVNYITKQNAAINLKKYKRLLNANLFTAYGMLICFSLQGYGLFSISFSTLSIFVSYIFAFTFWKDLNRLQKNNISHWWIKASLLFNAISSLGAFTLAFMMATKTINQNAYLAAVYFFLHFQYNGWFFFACMGLATAKFLSNVPQTILKNIFWLFAGACIPAYVLSALWLPIPSWSYAIVVIAAFCQIAGWALTLQQIKKQLSFIKSNTLSGVLWIISLSAIALTIKLLLQLGSTIPSLSNLAFGFRPIVIGYLHLILLGVITLFLLGYMTIEKCIVIKKGTLAGIKIFVAGVIINELLLMIQGVAAMNYMPIQFINELLLGAALFILTGIAILFFSQLKQQSDFNHK
jgi:hypothetical protein